MREFPALDEQQAKIYLDVPSDEKSFVRFINDFSAYYLREFPWRETTDVYRVFLSEVMLQQTQTQRVRPKYEEFLGLWPDFLSLSQVPFDQLLSHWKGLGYNRRALNLQKAAKSTEAWGWTIPNDRTLIESLPGIGPATASAIQCFCYHDKAIYLETNIRRVLIYAFFPGDEKVRDAILEQKLSSLLTYVDDTKNWYYALMDYGVLLKCLISNPNKKSAVYHKQSTFKDSNRQIRGQLIHLLSETGTKDKEAIVHILPFESERIEYALQQLVDEGLVQELAEGYRISR
ncbi:MAG: DNA repair protein [Sphaerochaetaceae bacterium]